MFREDSAHEDHMVVQQRPVKQGAYLGSLAGCHYEVVEPLTSLVF